MGSETKAEMISICHKAGATRDIYGLWIDVCDCDQRAVEESGVVCWDNIQMAPDPDDDELELEDPQPCDAKPHLCIPADEAREVLGDVADNYELRAGGIGHDTYERICALLSLLPEDRQDRKEAE